MENSNCLLEISDLYKHLPRVQIDSCGRFKYIYIAVYPKKQVKKTVQSDLIVFIRGTSKYEYHNDIFERFRYSLKELSLFIKGNNGEEFSIFENFKLDVYGGGWMERREDGFFEIFGYSVKYGRMDHSKTADIVANELKIAREKITLDEQSSD